MNQSTSCLVDMVCFSLATFENIPKVDKKAIMNENKMKNSILIMVYNASTFKIKRKRKKYEIRLRES